MRQICNCAIEPLESRQLFSVVAQDLGWGVQGKVVTNPSSTGKTDYVSDAIVQSDSKPLILANNFAVGNDTDGYLLRYTVDGTRDQSFSSGGLIQLPKQGIARYLRVHPLPDGKLLVAATSSTLVGSSTYTSKLMLIRLNTDGSPDPTFGTGGIALTRDELPGLVLNYFSAVSPDGKILATLDTRKIWRFNSDGSLDSSFGINGVVTNQYTGGSSTGGSRLFLDSDGSFYAQSPLGVTKFHPDGSLDTTFGPIADGGSTFFYARQPDGKFLSFSTVTISPSVTDIVVARLNADGSSDAGFAVNGARQIDFGKLDTPSSLAVDSAGRILVGATTRTSSADPDTYSDFALARLLPDGSLDSSFGTGGLFVDPFVYTVPATLPGQVDDNLSVALLTPDNKIVAVGTSQLSTTEPPPDTNINVAITRYLPDVPINIQAAPFGPVNEGQNFWAMDGGSSYANGQIVRYEWDYGSNGRLFIPDAEGQSALLQAGNSPSAVIALRVTTSDGLRAMGVFPIIVMNLSPTADAGPDRRAVLGVPIQFSLRADDAVAESGKFTIDYGDGTAPGVVTTGVRNPQIITPSHTYPQKGIYTVSITYQDSDGAPSSDTTTVRVGDILANVYNDGNGDGTNFGDPPLPGVTVWLDINNNGILDGDPSSVTDANGDALFDGILPGTYKLRAQASAGWQPAFADSSFRGDYTTATNTATVGGKASLALTQHPMITGTVFNDLNGNGVRDPGENGVSGISTTMQLIGPVFFTFFFGPTTAADGFYRFRSPSMPLGIYRVSVAPPAAWVQTYPSGKGFQVVNVGAGQTVNADFGIQQVAGGTAKGLAFEDIDGDGVNGANDRPYLPSNPGGAGGGGVFIDWNNNGVLDLNERGISLASDSTWTVSQLAPGTYTFRAIPRSGWVQTLPAGDAGITVNIAAGATVANLNFGFHKNDLTPPQVTNFAFNRNVKPNRIEVSFSEPMDSNPTLTLQPVGGANINLNLTYDAATNTAFYTPSSAAAAILPDGNYRALFNATTTRDQAGNSLAGQSEWSFFVLKGDLNGDRTISIADFITLSSNFGKTNATYTDGDVNYDGQVTISDFIDLAASFNKTLLAPAPPQPAIAVELSSLAVAPSEVLATNTSHKAVEAKPALVVPRPARHHRRHSHRH